MQQWYVAGTAKKDESSEMGTAERGSMRDDVTATVLRPYWDTDFELVTFITESTKGEKAQGVPNFCRARSEYAFGGPL
jgi:hypothetical protein